MLSVVALVLDREGRARLADALRAHARVTYCETGDELIASAAVIQPAAAAAETLAALGARFPLVASDVRAFGERAITRAPEPALEQPRVALAS